MYEGVTHHTWDRWFYGGIAVLMIVLNLAAFGPALLSPATRTVPLPLTRMVTLHAVVSIAFLLLFFAQTTLIATHRTALHRRLGVAGAGLAAAFVVVGWIAAVEEARRGFDLSGDLVPRGTIATPATSLVPLNAFVLFALLVGLALWYRRRPEVHKRLMVLAMVAPVAGAPIAHLFGHWPALRAIAPVLVGANLLLLFSCPIFDRLSRGRVHPASWCGVTGVVVWTVVFFGIVPTTAAWRDFTAWLTR